MDTPSVCILFRFQVMKLALGLGGCHGDSSQLPTPHRPSSSSRQPFWARKERSGIPLLFLLLCREDIQLRVLWCYLIWLSPPGRGQWLATNPGGFLFALLYQLIIPRGDQRKEKKKNGIRVTSMLFIFYHLWQGQQRDAVFFPSLTLPLMSSSYCWADLTAYWYRHQKYLPSHSRLWIDSSSIISTFTSARALPPGA